MMHRLLAHAAELHTAETSQTEHILSEWWAGLGLYTVFIWVVYWLMRHRLSLATRLSLILAVSLIIGLVSYRWTPVLSGTAIVIGFGLALFLGLGAARGRS